MVKYAVAGAYVLVLLCLVSTIGLAGTRAVPSVDQVPLGDWSYDAMISLAADGLVPGLAARVFEGDFLFNRVQMAKITASIIGDVRNRELGAEQIALIDNLVLEYKPELEFIGGDTLDQWETLSAESDRSAGIEVFVMGYVRGQANDDSEADSTITVPYRASGFVDLPKNKYAIGTIAEKEQTFFYEPRDSTYWDKGFVRGFDRNFIWSVGREYQNWGPVYTGSLILSDNAPAFWQARGIKDVDFGKFLGKVKITQFASAFEDDGQTLYLFGMRYQKQLSDSWFVGVSETAKLSSAPNPLILVMPFYLYQHLFDEVDAEFNSLYGADFTYSMKSGSQIYGELLIDDITAPRIFGDRFERPRKTGYALGFFIPEVLKGDRLSTFRAEYILIDRLTYGATRDPFPELAYRHDSQIIGSPLGPNTKALYLRGEQYLSDKFSLIGEYLDQRQSESGEPERGKRKVLSLTAAYDIAPDKSVAFRVAPYDLTLPSGESRDGTTYELRASFAF